MRNYCSPLAEQQFTPVLDFMFDSIVERKKTNKCREPRDQVIFEKYFSVFGLFCSRKDVFRLSLYSYIIHSCIKYSCTETANGLERNRISNQIFVLARKI